MATCANCGKTFSPTRGDARYCSDRCRLVTFRNGVELAGIVKHHLSFGTTLDGDTDDRLRLREIMRAYPDAFRLLGEPMIKAALVTTPLPSGRCRWDLALMYSIMLDQPKPRLSRAGRTLMGEPCPSCERRMQPKSQTPKDTGGAGRSATVQILDGGHHVNRPASSAPTRKQRLHDPLNSCTTCKEFWRTHPEAALVAGGFPEGLAPHAWNEPPKAPRAWMR